MDEEILISRRRVTRRRALALGGVVSLGGLLAACGSDDETATTGAKGSATTAGEAATSDIGKLLDAAPNCMMSQEQTQGPYWFDVDSIRDDIREKRPGTRLDLALRVQDMSACRTGGAAAPVSNAVVEIWHCDAGGIYSGFESASTGGASPPGGGSPSGGPGGPPPASGGGSGSSGGTSSGSYSVGDAEAETGDDGTYLRGAQPTGRDGIARFTTIYPGWYAGRTVHIHLKAHVDKKTVLTTQLFFEERLNEAVFETSPYDKRTGRETFNEGDSIYHESGLVSVTRLDRGYLGVINLGIDA